ncbi:MAG: carboxypeptidase-like regulatory domain-containing protein [Bacteroidales bacterium]|nr:carboxypeptidase-like regulatory domain-containing protein [Bacteroidales bacterium]
MIYKSVFASICLLLSSYLTTYAQNTGIDVLFNGSIQDAQTGLPLSFATVQLQNKEKLYGCITDDDGRFFITGVKKGTYTLIVSFLGYQKLQKELVLDKNTAVNLKLTMVASSLKEVVVTASESRGITSSSQIDRAAMEHLQPTSFTDLLELLPGGTSKDPNLNSVNTIKLREVGVNNSDYDISSLGTSFVIDGVTKNGDANMQYIPGSSSSDPDYARNSTAKGIDMRTISTDNIESVEIVRGIPSVEYGNLTSGLVKITRKLKPTAWAGRFKADEYGKLFSMGKGFEIGDKGFIVNGEIGYLDSKIDPRNNFENYKRFITSLRMKKTWEKESYKLSWFPSLDYTGSFDNEKTDPDISFDRVDKFKSSYNSFGFSGNLKWELPATSFVKSIEINPSVNLQLDKLTRTKFVSLSRDVLIPDSKEEGEHDGLYLPYQYTADYVSDGKPFNSFLKAKGTFNANTFGIINNIKIGGEWNYAKNFGKGQIYDPTRPLNPIWTTRPRAYKDIPAIQNLYFFAEDEINIPIKAHNLRITGGVSSISMIGLDKKFVMQGKVYLDPRINALWSFPTFIVAGRKLSIAIAGGIGKATRMPVLAQLYPDLWYNDIVQLNYYHTNPEYKRLNIRTYIVDKTNYSLKPARNTKWEVRADINYNNNRLSVTYFREDMTSGFRNYSYYAPYTYKKYDTSGINPETIQGPPALEDLPYTDERILDGYTTTTNGTKLLKEGVEFQFTSQRIETIKTKITLNGAWFRSTYSNSEPMFSNNVSTVIDDVAVNQKYIGLYDWVDGWVKQQFNTNIILDTQIPKLGLIFSTSVQSMWFTSSQKMKKNGVPIAYIDITGELKPYTEESQNDKYLQWLVQQYNDAQFNKETIPIALNVNFKATKKIGKFLSLALFVNKMLDYNPDYVSNGITVRRNIKPYFGMELNLNL